MVVYFLKNFIALNTVTSWFLKILACPYLGASHFGHQPVSWKQFVLDTALLTSTLPHTFYTSMVHLATSQLTF